MLFIAGLSVAGADARERVGGVVTGRGDPQERALAVAQSGSGGASERSPGAHVAHYPVFPFQDVFRLAASRLQTSAPPETFRTKPGRPSNGS